MAPKFRTKHTTKTERKPRHPYGAYNPQKRLQTTGKLTNFVQRYIYTLYTNGIYQYSVARALISVNQALYAQQIYPKSGIDINGPSFTLLVRLTKTKYMHVTNGRFNDMYVHSKTGPDYFRLPTNYNITTNRLAAVYSILHIDWQEITKHAEKHGFITLHQYMHDNFYSIFT